MRANKKKNSRPELSVRRALHARGFRYRIHYPIKIEGRVTRPDIVFPRRQVAVFIDGCFWHGCPEHGTTPRSNTHYWIPKLARNRLRDESTTLRLEAAGWLVIRIWEHTDPDVAAQSIIDVLKERA
jgi:DNA mismatch endonuclease (patch repair protein)